MFTGKKLFLGALGVGVAVFSGTALVSYALERVATTPYDANVGSLLKQINEMRETIQILETKVETTQKDIVTVTTEIVKIIQTQTGGGTGGTNTTVVIKPDSPLVEVVTSNCQGLYSQLGKDNDWLRGSSCNDVVYGNGGNDSLWGREGDDTIYAGSGKDTVGGGAGNDTIGLGSGGGSTAYGGAGNDTIYSGTGGNTAYGGAGNDTLYAGQNQASTIYGGTGDDLIYAKTSGSVVNTGSGNNTVSLVNMVNNGTLKINGTDVQKLGNGQVKINGKPYTADSSGKVTMPDGTVIAGLGNPAVKTCAWTYTGESCVSSSTSGQAAPSGACTCGQTTTKLRWKCANSTTAKPVVAKVSFKCQ